MLINILSYASAHISSHIYKSLLLQGSDAEIHKHPLKDLQNRALSLIKFKNHLYPLHAIAKVLDDMYDKLCILFIMFFEELTS